MSCLWRALLPLMAAVALHAQVVRVELRDSTTGGPVPGALVSARDSLGKVTVDALSNVSGLASLKLPAAGLWTITVRRIGLTPRRIPAIRVASGAVVALPLRVQAIRQALPPVRVLANAGICGRAPEGEDRAATLWEQITLALRASTLSRADSLNMPRLRIVERQRELTPALMELSSTITRSGAGYGRPYSALDPDSLASVGYVRREEGGDFSFFAPDEQSLLSEAFLTTHCFATPKRDRDPALAELSFRPVRGRSVADVEGTAFVDTLSGELRRIEFHYVVARRLIPVQAKHAGGEVVLRRLANGQWIVSNFAIRMPLLHHADPTSPVMLGGYREVGATVILEGEVTAPVKRDDDQAASTPAAP